MDINQFRMELLNEVRLSASLNETFTSEEFLKRYSSILIDAEEIGDFEQLTFIGKGSKGRHIQVDGYYHDELDNCLNIVICIFKNSSEVETLTASNAVYFLVVQ